MKYKLTLQRRGHPSADITVSADSTASVGDLAAQLLLSDPTQSAQGSPSRPTLSLVSRNNQLLDSTMPLVDTSLESGDTVALAEAGEAYSAGAEDWAAELTVIEGIGNSEPIRLRRGSNVVGRDASCEVAFSDPLISRRHARLNVTDMVEILDLGSANGTLVEGVPMPRAILRGQDVVTVGDTKFRVRMLQSMPASTGETGQVNHVRPPVIVPEYPGTEIEMPAAPERPRRQRFPLAPLFAPVLMGVVMYFVTRNVLSLMFIALTPIMLIGSFLEGRRVAKLDFAEAVAAYDAELEQVRNHLETLRDSEVSTRAGEHLSSVELLQQADRRGVHLWSRRADKVGFGAVRLGLGRMPTRNEFKFASSNRAPRDQVQRAHALAEEFRYVAPVPIIADFSKSAVGVGGPRTLALPVARSVVLQAVALHSPAEMVVAGFFSATSSTDWDWLKWLPHTSSPHTPIRARLLTSNAAASTSLLDELERLISSRETATPSWSNPAVLVVVECDPAVEHSRLVQIAESGPDSGVYVLWLAPQASALPAACKTFVELEASNSQGIAGYVSEGLRVDPITMEEVDAERVAHTARALAGVIDVGAPVIDSSDIPRQISLLAALEDEGADRAERMIERWQESASIVSGPFAPETPTASTLNLRAIVGQGAQGKHLIDLRADGPHALVGGTTGSGKSELLRSWILALAANHSPQRVNFLFVDYKGGSAFEEFRALPHSLGVVSNLGKHLVDRALTSLRAELNHRMALFLRHGAKDLDEMYAINPVETPPSLVIVVDEFAALVKEIPEFVDGMVDVGQRGRSLGLHLILATQQPKGVIKDNLRANTNLRIALRMADRDDSNDVLGSPEAAMFDSSLRGRAISKSGPTRLVQFQSAYSGGVTSMDGDGPEIDVEALSIANPESWVAPKVDAGGSTATETDLKRLVRAIADAATLAQLPRPRQAWLPELPPVINLQSPGDLPLTVSDTQIFFAKRDDPEHQAQPAVSYNPEDGNLAIVGTSGSGKSTAARMLALGSALASRQNPVHIYVIDYAGMALAGLEVLPNVGAVISGTDDERIQRVLKMLRATIDARSESYPTYSADSLVTYRRLAKKPDEPRILLIVDGLSQMKTAYEGTDAQKWLDLLASIMADGRSRGVHVIVTADQRSALTTGMASAVQRRLIMRMPTADDYSMLGVPVDVLNPESVPGRALDGKVEMQVACICPLPSKGSEARLTVTQEEQDGEIKRVAEFLTQEGLKPAPAVMRLPRLLKLRDLPKPLDQIVLGQESESLSPLLISPGAPFIVTGPGGSGRTNLMMHLASEARRAVVDGRFHLLAHKRSPLHELSWDSTCALPDDVQNWSDALLDELGGESRRHCLFIDSSDYFLNTVADFAIEAAVRRLVNDDHFVVVEGEPTTMSRDMSFVKLVRGERRGIALEPETDYGYSIFGVRFPPRINPADFPPGRGILVERRTMSVVQTPLIEEL